MPEKPEKPPRLKEDNIPVWWHHHGIKMTVEFADLMGNLLIIKGSAAEVIIIRIKSGFQVSWNIKFFADEWSSGQVIFSHEDIKQAFGLSDQCGEHGYGLLNEFGGTTAHQRRFIRYLNYLNIPGPGNGHDGDPNVSVEVTDQIKSAVKKMLWE